MIQGIYQSAAASDALQAWNDVIARNISGATTTGFKKETIAFEGISMGTVDFGLDEGRPSQMSTIAPVSRGSVNFTTGETRFTGDPHDFAIEGPGFFRLQNPSGGSVYTRDGQFGVSPDGMLIGKGGFPVEGDSGPIQLLADGGPILVDAEGIVRQGDQEVGKLSVFTFANRSLLKRGPGGFEVDPARPQEPQISETSRVQQGCVEMSNASPMREMMEIVAVSNALQANQRVIQNYDTMMERAIQTLGNPN